MLVSKNANICVTPTQTLKFASPPTTTPNASQWNKGCVGSPMQNFPVGSVHFIFCVLFSCVWWPTQTQFPVEYGLQYPPGLGPPALLADSTHVVAGGGGPGPHPCLKINQYTRVVVQGPVHVRQGEVREVKGHEGVRPEPACKVKVSIIRNKHFT